MAVTAKIWLCVKCGKLVDFVHWLGTEDGDLYNHCEKCSGIPKDWHSDKYRRNNSVWWWGGWFPPRNQI